MKFIDFILGAAIFSAVVLSGSVRAQTPLVESFDSLKLAGYSKYAMSSFSVNKTGSSSTRLYRREGDEKPHRQYWATLVPKENGAAMGFKTVWPCDITSRSDSLDPAFIWVNGRKIDAFYACDTRPGGSETYEVFIIKSPAGQKFVLKEFAKNEVVVVKLNSLSIPFSTTGFTEALTQLGGKAL